MENDQKHRSHHSGRKLFIGILLLLLVIAVGVSGLLFIKYKRAVDTANSSEREQIIQRLAPIIILPDEQPDLSTILDTSKLTNQVLKQRANNGDKLLIYNKAKRLIIYRPATGKVVDMLTIQTQTDAAGTE